MPACVRLRAGRISRRKAASVLNFRSTPKARKAVNSLYRRRLMYLFASLLLVVFVMARTRSENFVSFLDRLFREPAAPRQPHPATPRVSPGLQAASGRVPLEAPDPHAPFYERVRHDLLQNVEENVRFLPEERPAFFHLLRLLKETDAATIAEAPAQRVTRYELWTQSPVYRGKLVTVSGRVRGARTMPLLENPDGIREYYEIWLQPDGHAADPIAIYCLELPAGFPLGMDPQRMDERVEVKGFYYRRWWYSAQKENLIAPLVLAKTLSWTPASPPPPAPQFNVALVIAAVAALGVLAVGVAAFLFYRSSPKQKLPDHVRRYTKSGAAQEEGRSVGEALRRLEGAQDEPPKVE